MPPTTMQQQQQQQPNLIPNNNFHQNIQTSFTSPPPITIQPPMSQFLQPQPPPIVPNTQNPTPNMNNTTTISEPPPLPSNDPIILPLTKEALEGYDDFFKNAGVDKDGYL